MFKIVLASDDLLISIYNSGDPIVYLKSSELNFVKNAKPNFFFSETRLKSEVSNANLLSSGLLLKALLLSLTLS